jgi:hypothetical protein
MRDDADYGGSVTNPIVSIVQCGARPSMNRRCASPETGLDMITATATMIIGRQAKHPQEIQLRQIYHFLVPDPAYGVGVAQALGIDLVEFIPNGPHNSKP